MGMIGYLALVAGVFDKESYNHFLRDSRSVIKWGVFLEPKR